MAEPKSVAGLKQTEITIVEEKLSTPFGSLTIDIAGALSNRFDDCLEELNSATSEIIYAEAIKDDVTRKKKIADIMSRIKKAKADRQKKIWEWHPKIIAYIKKEYGEAKKDGNGTIIGYGDNLRVEVMKNKNLKKYW